jgi:hypothetical protein
LEVQRLAEWGQHSEPWSSCKQVAFEPGGIEECICMLSHFNSLFDQLKFPDTSNLFPVLIWRKMLGMPIKSAISGMDTPLRPEISL